MCVSAARVARPTEELSRNEFLWEREGKKMNKKEFKSTATTTTTTTTATAATTTAHTARVLGRLCCI